ncbi:MAG: RNA polymerase sigma factor (sigma-70 family) [Glaciecola sp.]|jgi:RNA polymerase sigma factor (sigma-70 family)
MEISKNLSDKARQDYKLVRQALDEKSQTAYAKLMERYRDSIYFMLLKMVNNDDDADYLTIEAFGKAFKRLEQYTPTYAFSTWLFKIASNNCIDFLRKKKKTLLSIDAEFENSDGDKSSFELEADDKTPDEMYMQKQRVQHMREIVTKLKPRYRELIELRYFKELSYEEISQELQIPLGTVKAQLFRARSFLSDMMASSKDMI